jgi:hypothetical protein
VGESGLTPWASGCSKIDGCRTGPGAQPICFPSSATPQASLSFHVLGYATPMAIAVIVPEDEKYAALVRHAAEKDLLIVDLQHLVLELRHDVANAEAATRIAQEATERLRAERRQGIADIRELLERFERR